jgi:D-sedoheptulose 7-phosphate isomerase
MKEFSNYLREKGDAINTCVSEQNLDLNLVRDLESLANLLRQAIGRKSMIFFFGNGGSAAEATHIAGEFTSYCLKRHDPWASISLNDSNAVLTAIPNDYDFDSVFERQIRALAKPGDVVIGLSTSGKSRNVLAGLEIGKNLGCSTVLLTSIRIGETKFSFCDLTICAKSEMTTVIQEIHLHWLHTIVEYLELTI